MTIILIEVLRAIQILIFVFIIIGLVFSIKIEMTKDIGEKIKNRNRSRISWAIALLFSNSLILK